MALYFMALYYTMYIKGFEMSLKKAIIIPLNPLTTLDSDSDSDLTTKQKANKCLSVIKQENNPVG